ncbi:alpha/beta fold hydrolase [Kitasatospora sp. NBC_01560]|uniref:thioesterase II family protein n=1 Tax=Kitasatospora sp. NBC_01560 TaxID=2975965 RepID=UPI00386AAC00
MTRPAESAPRRAGSPWLIARKRIEGTPARLYFFPHSGGSPGEYLRWAEQLPEVEIWGVQAPGRGSRIVEEPLTGMAELVEGLVSAAEFGEPAVFFGHSLGALVAFETARALRAAGLPGPSALVVSACPAPDRRRARTTVHDLPDDELLAVVHERYGGLPPEITADPALLELIMPYYRADFTVYETYRYEPGEPLDVPLHVVGGEQDIPADLLAAWAGHTTGESSLTLLPGGHFYFRDPAQHARLVRLLTEVTAAARN